MIQVWVVLLALAAPTFEQESQADTPESPCPTVFTYEPPGMEPYRWYGVANLTTDTSSTLWLTIVLDSKADILVNSIGNVTTQDNENYLIENTEVKLSPGLPVLVRFLVKYNPLNKPPRLVAIRLNGREICNVKSTQHIVEIKTVPVCIAPYELGLQDICADDVPSGTWNSTSAPVLLPRGAGGHPQNQCGRVVLNAPLPLIVNGSSTLEGQWPWQIALYESQSVNIKYICGGTLVSHRHVITAAHCIPRKNSEGVLNKNTLTVYLGKHNLRTSIDGVQVKLVGNVIVHPNYNASTNRLDIAILVLIESVTYTNWVQPACLWPEDQIDLTNVIGKKGLVPGWGFNGNGATTEELSMVKIPVVDTETCIRSNSEFFARFTSDYTYCAGYRNGTSVCNGDSGGGMVFRIGEYWYLRGLVSRAVAIQNEQTCDPAHYAVFSDIAKFLPWIKQTIDATTN